MRLIQINPDLLTGVEEMDRQHMRIADYINHVADLISEDKLEEAIEFFKETLLPFVKHHLASEENFMLSIEYPDYETHRKHHDWVLNLFIDVANKLSDKKSVRQAISLLTGWLYGHVGSVDKKYGVFITAK